MQNFLVYITEVSILTSVFFLFYRYLYFKLAYFVWSRYFFYTFLIASLIVPILPEFLGTDFIILKIESITNISEGQNIAYVNVENSFLNNQDLFWAKIPFVKIIFIIWFSGFVRYLLRIIKSIYSITKLKAKGKVSKDENFTIIQTNSDNHAFSFMNNIYVNKEFETLSEDEKKQIKNHEKIHAKQKHTIDNIVFEIFRSVFWFNPISKSISANIKVIHEFIVDNVLTGNKNKPDYSRLILKLATHKSHAITISSFSKEEIINRIKLITFPENEKIRKRRFALSIPVLIVTFFASWIIFSTINIYAFEKSQTNKMFQKPFKDGSSKIISPFFENKVQPMLFDETGEYSNYKISHKEVSYEVKDYSEVYAVETGKISHIKEKNIFELKEFSIIINLNTGYKIEYSGLYKTTVTEGEIVNKGDLIGVSGDIRLYPSVNIRITKDNKEIDPEELY